MKKCTNLFSYPVDPFLLAQNFVYINENAKQNKNAKREKQEKVWLRHQTRSWPRIEREFFFFLL